MSESRKEQIESYSLHGDTIRLKKLFDVSYTQSEIDIALELAVAYSYIETADYLLSLGADLTANGYNGVYYAVHNDELKGLQFAINNGVDINVNNGMLLNTSIMTALNSKSIVLIKWLFENGATKALLTKQSLGLVAEYGNEELKAFIKNAK